VIIKYAGMAELADALDLGSSAQKACRFKSCSRHQTDSLLIQNYFSTRNGTLLVSVPPGVVTVT
jgi:hypothetical protein